MVDLERPVVVEGTDVEPRHPTIVLQPRTSGYAQFRKPDRHLGFGRVAWVRRIRCPSGSYDADADGQHTAGIGIDVAVDQPESPGWAPAHVELHAGESGQIAAYVPGAQRLTSHSPMRQVIESAAGRRHDVDAIPREACQVTGDLRVRAQPIARRLRRPPHAGRCLEASSIARVRAASSSSSSSHGRLSARRLRARLRSSSSSACASSFSQVAIGTNTACARRCDPKNTGSLSPASRRGVILPSPPGPHSWELPRLSQSPAIGRGDAVFECLAGQFRDRLALSCGNRGSAVSDGWRDAEGDLRRSGCLTRQRRSAGVAAELVDDLVSNLIGEPGAVRQSTSSCSRFTSPPMGVSSVMWGVGLDIGATSSHVGRHDVDAEQDFYSGRTGDLDSDDLQLAASFIHPT